MESIEEAGKHPTITKDEEGAITVDSSTDPQDSWPVERLSLCRVGKLLTAKRFNASAMNSTFTQAWQLNSGVAVRDLGPNLKLHSGSNFPKGSEPVSKEHLQLGSWMHAPQSNSRLRPTIAEAERGKHWLKTQGDKGALLAKINAAINENIGGVSRPLEFNKISPQDQAVEKQFDGSQYCCPLSFEPTYLSVHVTAQITENSPDQSNTSTAHAIRAWSWSSGCSGGFGFSDCSWRYWMLGTGFRGSVASLVLVVSGCRRANLKFSSPLVVVLLRSLWIVPFLLLVVGLWLATSFVESGLLRLVFDVALRLCFFLCFCFDFDSEGTGYTPCCSP